jgi:hypothetical protein
VDPLATPAELDTYLQRPVNPDVALLAVQGASGAVRAQCQWSISQQSAVTLRVDALGWSPVLTLPTMHLTAVTEVRLNGDVLTPGNYRWSARGQLYRPAGWGDWTVVEVDCTHGYDPVPDVVRLVTLSMAARYVSNPDAVRIAAVGSVQRTYFELTALDENLLDPYRL